MDEDDIYGSILSEPRSNSTSNQSDISAAGRSNENYSDIQPTSSQFAQLTPQPSLFLTNLTWWTNEDNIRAAFGDAGTRVKEIQFLEHKPNGKSKGMANVLFPDVETATVAKGLIEGREINGKVCEVNYSRSIPVKPYERVYQQRDQSYHANRGHFRPFQHQNHYQQQHQRPEPGQRVQYQNRPDQREDFPVDREIHWPGQEHQNQSQRGRSQLNESRTPHYQSRSGRDNYDEQHRKYEDRSRSPDRYSATNSSTATPSSASTTTQRQQHSSSNYYKSSSGSRGGDHRQYHR